MGAQAFIPPSLARSAPLDRPSRSRGAEACALLLFFGACFFTVALLSYEADPNDPSLTGANWMGAVGATLAGALVGAFGAGAWWVSLELILIGAPLLRGRRPEMVGLRLAGDLLILVLIASLIQVAAPDLLVFGGSLPGGNVGLLFGELMRGLFSAPGSFLVGLTGMGLILIGRSSFSFIEWCQKISRAYRGALVFLLSSGRRLNELWQKATALRRAASRGESLNEDRDLSGDAAILARLEAEQPWIPLESTGAPPLAVSESLRKQMKMSDLWDDESEPNLGEAVSGLGAIEPESTDPDFEVFAGAGAAANSECGSTDEPSGTSPSDLDSGPDWATLAFGDADEDDGPSGEEPEPPQIVQASFESITEAEELDEEAEVEDEECAAQEQEKSDGTFEPRIVDTSKAQATRAARREKSSKQGDFELPDTNLLLPPAEDEYQVNRDVILRHSDLLEKTLSDYGVTGKVEEIHPGPTVTTYEVAPAAGTKVSKVAGLSDDLALGLSRKVRIIAPIPGKSRIGFEVPNDDRVPVNLRELVEDERFQKLAKKAPLPVVLGRDIVGAPFYADLATMPHVIVAGATGAGKSVGLNVMLSSLLFKRSPEELRLLMVDPKVVELAPFDKIPHLLLPVVTDMNQASQALKWAVDEMERRYQLFADAGTKNITTYNRYVERVCSGEIPPPKVATVEAVDHNGDLIEVPAAKKGEDGAQLPERIPYIVIVVDEFADLIMQQGKEVEASVARLAQKARAAGMHVILATQRPSVDVITGMIKANFPSRIAFRVAQKVDSRTILDEMGAEVLLGKGDMLVKLNGATDTLRVQCPFVSEEEINDLCDHLRTQGEPKYDEAILQPEEDDDPGADEEPVDARFEEAVLIVRDSQRCSTSWLQRKMTIGYNRAAKMVDMMERRGYVGPPNGSKDREVMLPP